VRRYRLLDIIALCVDKNDRWILVWN